jgi:hypothetical protein
VEYAYACGLVVAAFGHIVFEDSLKSMPNLAGFAYDYAWAPPASSGLHRIPNFNFFFFRVESYDRMLKPVVSFIHLNSPYN